MSELVLTHAIDCEWCIAKAGEPCYIQPPSDQADPRPDRSGMYVHTIRAVPREQHEAYLAAVADHPAGQSKEVGA